MGIVFKALHPLFGRTQKPLGVAYQHRSPYYWWWEFLRRNEEYLDCCRNNGKGKLAPLFADFGVVLHDSFKSWWERHGYALFAEKPLETKVKELQTPAEWDPDWDSKHVMVVAVPLGIPKRQLQAFFGDLLKKRHPGKPGRKALGGESTSTARYPLYRNVSIHTLRIQLAVFDEVMAKKRGETKKSLAQIGADLRLVKSALPSPADTRYEAELKRRVMAATVSRHFKDAQRIIANTSLGQFPNSEKTVV